MAQSVPPENLRRDPPPASPPPDLDALLKSLHSDARTPAASGNATGGASNPERQQGDLTAQRVRALIRAFDVLHTQVAAIAGQGETISKLAEVQARDAKAIVDMQRQMRALRQILIQQLQQSSGSDVNLPQLQVKLLLGHLVEAYHQAERDAAALIHWAMLFVGVALGLSVAAVISVWFTATTFVWMLAAGAILMLFVALIFGSLARSARSRAANARRAMDESALLRTVGLRSNADPQHQA